MSIDWGKLDKQYDLDGIEDKVAEAASNSDFPDIPEGEYEVMVVNMELGKSKKKDDGTGDDPMLKIQFEILDGEYKGYKLFYSGVMQAWNEKAIGFQIHNNNEMLRDLWDAGENDVKFKGSFKKYNELILDIADEIIEDGWEYVLKKGKTTKGYDTYEIVEILD